MPAEFRLPGHWREGTVFSYVLVIIMLTLVLLACEYCDIGIVPAAEARAEAEHLADELGALVSLRDPITDEVLSTVQPNTPSTSRRSS